MADVYNLELKSCPFCGGIPSIMVNELQYGRTRVKIVCGECLESIQREHHEKAITLATASWNRRATDD